MKNTVEQQKSRFFKDELESSTDVSSSFNASLNNNESFLFRCPEPESVQEDTNKADAACNQVEDTPSPKVQFHTQIKEVIPDLDAGMVDTLYTKFKDSEDVLSKAISYYFEHGIIESKDEVVELQRLPSSSPSKDIFPTFSSEATPAKRKKTFGFRAEKKLKPSVLWKKFIGSLQVSAMATRPTLKPLKYGSEMHLVKSAGDASLHNLFDSRGRQKKKLSNHVRVVDAERNREVGKVPEETARILYPLLGTDEISFEATLVFCNNKRLSVGDGFVLQLDCFLASTIFDRKAKTPGTSSSQKSSTWGMNISISETDEELVWRFRTKALISLFNKIRIHPVENDEDAGHTNQDNEIIDLEDDESFENLMSQDSDPEADSHYENRTMNLNQLKTFYSVSQSFESQRSLPETDPPKDLLKVQLRAYQKQGLTWMLRREHEFDKANSNGSADEVIGDMMNPLWKKFSWPKDMSWEAQKLGQGLDTIPNFEYFYANLHTGEFSTKKPVLRSIIKGGILSDEMGLGKTISALSLVLMAPEDSQYQKKDLFRSETGDNLDSDIIEKPSEVPYASKTTLIVVPMSLLTQWNMEFNAVNNCSDKRCEVYYGGNVSSLKTLLTMTKNPPAVVLTTYGIVQNEWNKLLRDNKMRSKISESTGLFAVDFYRVIIDEGHTIRNRGTVTSKAIMDLRSRCRWVLTGTPIINRLDDLYSLVKFLDLEPWSQVGYWKTFISEPFENKNFKQAFDVVNAIMQPVVLRRTKDMKGADGKPLVVLPPKEITIEKLKLNNSQAAVYKYLLNKAEDSVKLGLARGDLLKKYSTILVHILRLRQICCDIELLGSQDENDEDLAEINRGFQENADIKAILNDVKQKKNSSKKSKEQIEESIINLHEKYPDNNSLTNLECSICTTEPIDPHKLILTDCGHPFCDKCILEYITYQKEKKLDVKCPICREMLDDTSGMFCLKGEVEQGEDFELTLFDNTKKPAKIEALVKGLQQLQDSSSGEQVIVFSQFSSYLDILERDLSNAFSAESSKIYKFDGRLSLKERSAVLADFQLKDFSKQKILLLSLKAGGVGLNLTCASRAYMMDPWWSPSMEDQAIDRLHRIGQTNSVKVVRFIIENSIEEKMLRIQERKRTIGEAMDADEDERRRRRIEEIKTLFE
ncbi:DNA helicase RAD5 KNAG_0A06030 [Huiozyma naganishii CBS 8797]|uniref:DNA repair protein RAD5 n=1 Tax=Huiozyma naganishii (strain ATCC MYA-139 / BCRC 22969 / CBS 8797 / KCTC 17520 / NBRC 10181 / NCYC 3082 / Yp74L-3) TaxID=1071383 RepID=J7R0D7_HUIN7|nr:hypothetical protein KNAG_0A06030 [Kazachstania naganishii CBS 8797]CCK68265.1 hypothetical protein KNAG_0A06030 [Kazachstania naganishii CBS 8797]